MYREKWLGIRCDVNELSGSRKILFFLFTAAYKHADGKRIDGRRISVDVERGRTVKGWKPRRLGELNVRLMDFPT